MYLYSLSAGWISTMFVTDLLADPAARGVADVRHVVAAVASRSADKAEQFVKDTWAGAKAEYKEGEVKTYGDYAQLFTDKVSPLARAGECQQAPCLELANGRLLTKPPLHLHSRVQQDVVVVYIGTPHSNHYQNAHEALTAGKHVLCEKSLTVTAAQAQALAEIAHAKGLFLMEAVWTRFQPITYKIQDVLASGVLGEVCAVQSQLGINWKGDDSHRMVNPDLAGGALLDVGPYAWTWLALLLLPRASTDTVAPLPLLPVAASMLKHTSTRVDISTVATLQFSRPDGTPIHATMHAAFNAQNSKTHSVLVQCERGWLGVHWLPQRPAWFEYKGWASADEYGDFAEKPCQQEERVEVPTPEGMMGFAFEADEVARCVRDGRGQSARMPVRESVLMLAVSSAVIGTGRVRRRGADWRACSLGWAQTFDEIRRQGGLTFPDSVETLETGC